MLRQILTFTLLLLLSPLPFFSSSPVPAAAPPTTPNTKSLAHENENNPFWVHGRLSPYNGTPTFRIWVIGTKRMLGVSQRPLPANPDYSLMPDALFGIFFTQESMWAAKVYADFLVEPLAPDEKGVMRPVKILAAKNIVVANRGQLAWKEENIIENSDAISKSQEPAVISHDVVFWPVETTCPMPDGGVPENTTSRIFTLPDGASFKACFGITSKGNGTLTFPGISVGVLDCHDDTLYFKNGLLRCRWEQNDDGTVEFKVNGTAYRTDEKGGAILESTPISAVFRYDPKTRLFKAVRCSPQIYFDTRTE